MIFNQSFRTRRLQSIFGSKLVIRRGRIAGVAGDGRGRRVALVVPLGGVGTPRGKFWHAETRLAWVQDARNETSTHEGLYSLRLVVGTVGR